MTRTLSKQLRSRLITMTIVPSDPEVHLVLPACILQCHLYPGHRVRIQIIILFIVLIQALLLVAAPVSYGFQFQPTSVGGFPPQPTHSGGYPSQSVPSYGFGYPPAPQPAQTPNLYPQMGFGFRDSGAPSMSSISSADKVQEIPFTNILIPENQVVIKIVSILYA